MKTYELNTVTCASASYLATRVLRELATAEEPRFPLGAKMLHRDTYVDDILTGAPDVATACHLQQQTSSLCLAGGFPLRK